MITGATLLEPPPPSYPKRIPIAANPVPENVKRLPSNRNTRLYLAEWEFFNHLLTKNSVLDSINKSYVVVDPKSVATFIEEHRLRGILDQAIEPLNRAFGASSIKQINIFEDDEGGRTLFCAVKFPGALADAIRALDAFDEDWWVKNAARFGARLNFDFELI
jgi:hypothetical protein